MRIPVYRVVNDDDPGDYAYPLAVSWRTLLENGDTAILDIAPLKTGESVTIGGGAAVQFTITRIR